MSNTYTTAISSITDSNDYTDDRLDGSDFPLFGRREELLSLTVAYYRVKNTASFEIALVHGESGSGKTSIVRALRKRVVQNEGFFCAAKFFQHEEQVQEPYSAIMAAFSDLCDLTLQADDFDETRRTKIKNCLGSDAQMLMKSVSNISPFLDEEIRYGMGDIKIDSSFAKFKLACKKFLRVMPTKEHPVVMLLDDIQWMDQGSKKLIETFLQDTEIKNLMLILSCREENIDICKDILDVINSKESLNTIDIHLRNLDVNAVTEMVLAKLGSVNSEEVCSLAKLVARKTQGNPFHIQQFLTSIEKDRLIVFNILSSSWEINLERIQEETKIADSIAELITRNIQSVDIRMCEMMKVASIIGYQFSEDVTIKLTLELYQKKRRRKNENWSVKSLQFLLQKAVCEGLLEKINGKYQFSHDKIQIAFQNMMKESQKEKLHLKLSRVFICQTSEVSTYHSAVHLNRASEIHFQRTGNQPPYVEEDGVQVAKLNFDAAKYCEGVSAFSDSAIFLRRGLNLIDNETKWTEHFDLTFQMTESLAKMEFIAGNLDACEVANEDISRRAKSIEMKMKSLVLRVEIQQAKDDLEVERVGIETLKELKVYIPRVFSVLNLLRKLVKVRKLFDNNDDEKILYRKRVDDPKILTTIKILSLLAINCSMRNKSNLASYFALIAAEQTLKQGISPYSSIALYMWGVVEIYMGKRDRACRLGMLSLKLVSLIPCKEAECTVVGGGTFWLFFMQKRISDLSVLCTKAVNGGFQIGDVTSVAISLGLSLNVSLWNGENLNSLAEQMLELRRRICDFGENQDAHLMLINPTIQFILNMQNQDADWRKLTLLTGTIMDEDVYMTQSSSRKDWYATIIYFCKMVLSYTFGLDEEAETFLKHLSGSTYTKISFLSLPFNFYAGMLSYRLYHSTRLKRHLQKARKFTKFLAKEKLNGNPNVSPYLTILQIEILPLKRVDPSEILKASNDAIRNSAKESLPHLEALANEQAHRILSDFGYATKYKYLKEAMHIYRDKWGARAKYLWLLEKIEMMNMEDGSYVLDQNLSSTVRATEATEEFTYLAEK